MNALDLLLVALLVAGAVGGFRLGFVTRVASWVGLVAGLVLAVVALGPLLGSLDGADAQTLLLVTAAVVFVGALGGQALGLAVGARFRPATRGPVRRTDRVAGGVVGIVGVVALIWLLVPVIADTPGLPAEDALTIALTIRRNDAVVFEGRTSTARIVRRWSELIGWLGRDNSFPDGAVLLTGTGIVPPDEMTLKAGDRVAITIDGIGTLDNPVVQSAATP